MNLRCCILWLNGCSFWPRPPTLLHCLGAVCKWDALRFVCKEQSSASRWAYQPLRRMLTAVCCLAMFEGFVSLANRHKTDTGRRCFVFRTVENGHQPHSAMSPVFLWFPNWLPEPARLPVALWFGLVLGFWGVEPLCLVEGQ